MRAGRQGGQGQGPLGGGRLGRDEGHGSLGRLGDLRQPGGLVERRLLEPARQVGVGGADAGRVVRARRAPRWPAARGRRPGPRRGSCRRRRRHGAAVPGGRARRGPRRRALGPSAPARSRSGCVPPPRRAPVRRPARPPPRPPAPRGRARRRPSVGRSRPRRPRWWGWPGRGVRPGAAPAGRAGAAAPGASSDAETASASRSWRKAIHPSAPRVTRTPPARADREPGVERLGGP